jgi:hypothetical protein
MNGKLIFSVIILLLLVNWLAAVEDVQVHSVSSSPTSLAITATFPVPQRTSSNLPGNNSSGYYLYYTGWPEIQQAGYPRVPVITKLFSLPGQKINFSVKKLETAQAVAGNYLYNEPDPAETSSSSVAGTVGTGSTPWVEISYQGLFRGLPLFAIHFFPVKVDPQNQRVEYIKTITVDITVATIAKEGSAAVQTISATEHAVLNQVLLNGNSINYKTLHTLAKPAAALQRFKNGRYKILLGADGLYQISYDDLVKYEVPLEQFDTRKLIITERGQEIPVYFKGGEDGVFNPGDYFEFWAEKNKNQDSETSPDLYNDPFSDVNVYWLEQGEKNGLRMVEENGALRNTNSDPFNGGYYTPPYFLETIHFEKDISFIRLGNASVDSVAYKLDHWFYDNGISAVGSRSYKAFLPYPYNNSTRSVFAKAMMRGLSLWDIQINNYNNHQVEIWLNNEKVGDSGPWMNQDLQVISNIGGQGIFQGNIQHGDNDFRIVMDQPGVTDIALLNWFEITYQRQYRAYQNSIKFKQEELVLQNRSINTFQFEIDGFNASNIEVYKPGISKLVNNRVDYITAEDNISSYRLTFQDEIFYPGIEYVVLTPDAKKKPLRIVADLPWNPEQSAQSAPSLLETTNSAEYLIVTDGSFYENVLQLKAYRQQAGLKTEVVCVEDIYDEFNYGIKSPIVLRDFLKYVYENWDQSRPLLYVVLVGDASYDYKTTSVEQKDLVPTLLFETKKYGATAADDLYALVSGTDPIPDLIISRIPIRDNAQLTAYLGKIQEYEDPTNRGEWRNKGLFISGNDAATNEQFTAQPAFRAQNQRLINMNVPSAFISRKLNTIRDQSLPSDPNFGSTTDLINYFDDGLSFVTFYGHGGGGIWSDVQLLNNDDIDRLNNQGKYPFITSMTCFTGSFENSSMDAIAEKLLLAPAKGAIGLYASSGLGWLHNDFALGWNLTSFMYAPGLTLGEAMLLAEIHYLANDQYVTEEYSTIIPGYAGLKYSMVRQYNLLGDPYLSLTPPADELKLSGSNSMPQPGDTLQIVIQAPFLSGAGRIELANENHELITEQFYTLNNAQAAVSLSVPENLPTGQYLFAKAQALSSSGDQDARGVLAMTINKPLVDSVLVSPQNLQVGDSVFFSVFITTPLSLNRVRLINLKGANGSYYVLNLTRTGDSLWTHAEGFGPYSQADTIGFDIEIMDGNGDLYLSRLHEFTVADARPDLEVVKNSIRLGGAQEIELQAVIRNNSSFELNQVDLGVFLDSYTGAESPYSSLLLDLQAGQKQQISIPLAAASLLTPDRKIFMVIDYPKKITERYENNNEQYTSFAGDLYSVTSPLGTSADGLVNDTVNYQGLCRFFVAPQSINLASVLKFSRNQEPFYIESKTQPGFSYLTFEGITDSCSIEIELLNQSAQLSSPAYLEFSLATEQYGSQFLQNIYICKFEPRLGRWVALAENTLGPGKIYTNTLTGGEFALFHIEDNDEPEIEITINGRTIHQDMMIPENPRIAFILQDKNGINLSSGFSVMVDENSLPGDWINYPDSIQNANAISILATPELSAGKHNLTVSACDAKGNTTTRSVDFIITGDFQIQIFGNYPNPFTESTIIALQIISPNVLDELEVKIYTVSGRLIRKITSLAEYPDEQWDPGYHEIEWNGRDNDGIKVANGVYFAVLRAKLKGESIEKTLKLAKLR